MSNRRSFTPQVQDSDGQSNSKHFVEESRDYLLSNSHENQSEGNTESTDDGFYRFTDHQVHMAMFVVYDICFFSPIDLNNFHCKTFDHCTLFCLKT